MQGVYCTQEVYHQVKIHHKTQPELKQKQNNHKRKITDAYWDLNHLHSVHAQSNTLALRMQAKPYLKLQHTYKISP